MEEVLDDDYPSDYHHERQPSSVPAAVPPSAMKRCCNNATLSLRQFFLLLGKNFLLQFRRPIITGFELLFPIAAVAVLVILRFTIPSLATTKKCYITFGTDQLTIPAIPGTIYYAPNDTQVEPIVSRLRGKLAEVSLVGVATQEEFITIIENTTKPYLENGACINNGIGIYFEDVNQTDIRYSIRTSLYYNYNVKEVAPVFELSGAQWYNAYSTSGFMQLQKVIDESIIEWKTDTEFTIDVDIRQFPIPDYNQNFFLDSLRTFLPLLMVLTLMLSVGIFVKELVSEKDSRMKETMRMMGLSNWTLISSWFVKQILFYVPSIFVMAMLLKYGKIYPQSNIFLLFVLLLLYFMTAVAFTFFVSVWFTSAWLGMFAGFIIWFVSFLPYFFLQPRYSSLSYGVKMSTSLISNICVGYAVQILTTLEIQEDGLQFSSIGTSVTVDDDLNIAWLMLMMVVDIMFYMSLYWYVDAIKPGKYGTPKPIYFPFIPSFWLGNIARRKVKPEDIDHMTNDSTAHEPDPNLEVGISINRLTKIFDGWSMKSKLAVDNLSLNMYKGQVTALLGHNGAGKTTTMSILTGLYTPTTGNAYINGYSVLNEMDLVRRSLGICPQHNVLFDQLTVHEHLYFFSLLKGTPANQVKDEVNRMIADLQLSDKRKTLAKKLSGGMKRKLSVGIALIGQSEIVILDEPTSGMDPYARRATWDLLVKHKEERTILLTTHFMDEADVLGDRIAIMVEGQLRCSGSPLFLKSKFGVGYHMTIVKEPDCDSRRIISAVKGMIEGSKEVTNVGAELSFILPTQSKGQFPELFDILERDKDELGISSFGVSVTTMEEVFIKVGRGDDFTLDSKLMRSRSRVDQSLSVNTKQPAPVEAMHHTTNKDSHSETVPLLEDESKPNYMDMSVEQHYSMSSAVPHAVSSTGTIYRTNRGIILWFQQLYAVFIKHFLHAIRFWPSLIWQLLIPLSFVVFSLVFVVTYPTSSNNTPSRVLSLRNTAPANTINFFKASLGGSSFPYEFKSNETRAIGISEYNDFTDSINEIKEQVADITSIDQCCSYKYQILDKFCASRKLGEYQEQCKDVESFSFNECIECLDCSTPKPSTCTNPGIINYYQSCPVSPTVSFNDIFEGGNLIGALDGYDTFVAEKLLRDSGKFSNPNSFFRLYLGGFVIHPESPKYSACGANRSDVCQSLSPTLSYNYPPENETEFIQNSTKLLQGYPYRQEVCKKDLQFNLSDPFCSSSNWNSQYNWAVEACIDNAKTNCGNAVTCGSDQYVGSVSEPQVTNQPKVTIWYNNQPLHTAPAVLNSFYSLHLQRATGHTITVKNHPLPERKEDQVNDLSFNSPFFGYILSFIAVFGTCFLFSSFVIFLIQEKQTKAKHIQFVSGVGATSYWLGTYLYDMISALIPTICIVIIFAAFNVEGFRSENLAAIFLLFLLSTWAAIPISYIFSFLFSNSLIAFALLIIFHYFLFFMLLLTKSLVSPKDAKILYYIFLLHPTFGLGNGLSDMYINQINKIECTKSPQFELQCEQAGITYIDSIFSFDRPGINWTFIYLFLDGIVLFILTLLIERGFFVREIFSLFGGRRISNEHRGDYSYVSQTSPDPYEDDDVASERQKVTSREELQDTDVVIIRDIRKVYKGVCSFFFPCVGSCKNQYKTAVNGVNLVITTGECFGLLGVNGAGKTTMFNMLTGDIIPSSGTATVAGYDIRTQLHKVHKRIGYCPQFDAIIELLTGRELLTMFARLRGVPEHMIKDTVQFEINRLDLSKHANKKCGTYSGGNKRKLSTAVALIGNPPIIFLDEPTTGMDPVTRRFLWDSLLNIVSEGRSVIITSHSMEECEALCSRLAIMVNGRFKCLGSCQHLKSKFGKGYSVQIKVSQQHLTNPPNIEAAPLTGPPMVNGQPLLHTTMTAIKGFIHHEFPNAHIEEEHQNTITYHIPTDGVTWSSMFRKIEENKDRFGIEDYSISQTTLDQIFINFAREQEGGIDVLYN